MKVPAGHGDAVRSPPVRVDLRALAAWGLSFFLVTFLAFRGGGYDIVPRSQAGLAVWWILLLGALAGVITARVERRAVIAVAALAAFTAWSALAVDWTQSTEQTVIEAGRLCTYLGILVLTVAVLSRTAARHTVNGLTCAIALVSGLALLSRLHPQAFAPDPHLAFLNPVSIRKLSYPLGYWNALADFAAMGIPLLLTAAVTGRTRLGRAVAAAFVPVPVGCVYLTISRGGAIAVAVGVAVLLVLVPKRIEVGATLLVAAAGSALLLSAIAARPALTSGVPSRAAIDQGNQIVWMSLGIALVAGLAQIAITHLTTGPQRSRLRRPGRRATARLAAIAGMIVIAIAVTAGVPARLDRLWHDFTQPAGVVVPGSDSTVFSRLQAANGNSRYQFWQAALQANATDPWRGIGPGTFQFWWTAHPTAQGFVRNAHSLYFETLAETGIVGVALLLGLLVWCAVLALTRAVREPRAERAWLAGVSAAFAVFLFAAALEWVWQIAAFAAAALILCGLIVAGHGPPQPHAAREPSPRQPHAAREPSLRSLAKRRSSVAASVALALASAVALAAILMPLAEQLAVRSSQSAAARGRLGVALGDAIAATRLAPWASGAHLQQALVLEAAGELALASAAARAASDDSPTDWTTWLIRARIDAERGANAAARSELARARALNPRSALFAAG